MADEAAAKPQGYLARHLSCETVSYSEFKDLFIPLLLENTLGILFSLINSFVISSAGMTTLSAVSMVDTYISMLMTVFTGIATGASIVVAQYHGAHRFEQMKRSAVSSITAVTLFGTLLALFSILCRGGIVQFFFGGAEADVLTIAKYYLAGNCISLPFYAFHSTECAVLRGVGEGKSSTIIALINSCICWILNWFFVIFLGWGIRGLIISIFCMRFLTMITVFIVKRIRKSILCYKLPALLVFDWQLLKRIFKFGFPISFENLLFNGGRLILQMIISPMGTNVIASYNIAYNVMSMSQCLNAAMSTTMFITAGTCMGAGRPDDCKKLFRNVFKINTLGYAFMAAVVLLLNRPICAAFHAEPDMLPVIFVCLAITMAAQITVHTSSFMIPNILRAAGDVVYTTIISIASMWGFRVLGAFLLGRVFGIGVYGVYIAMAMDWTFRAIIFLHRYKQGKWERMHVI